MIHIDTLQGSGDWFKARAGVPTASEFHRILTPSTLKLSKQSNVYMHRLLAEWMTGQVFEVETKVWAMDRGIELEQEAVDYYDLTVGKTTTPAGFCLTDDRNIGASPDRFVGDDGLLEIKCPLAPTHVGWLLEYEESGRIPSEHVLQVQGQLFVTQRSWHHFLSYYPGMPPLLIRSEPDPAYQDAIAAGLATFCLNMEQAKRKLQAMKED